MNGMSMFNCGIICFNFWKTQAGNNQLLYLNINNLFNYTV